MIPEGLVLLTSIAFAVGVVRLGRQGCLVQELGAVEGLARVDVVCADKTGTLTEDRMEVVEVAAARRCRRRPDRHGAGRAGRRRRGAERVDRRRSATAFAEAPGWPPTARAAFSSARKWSGVSFGDHGNWVIGAPEMLLPPGDRRRSPKPGARAEQGLRVLLLGHGVRRRSTTPMRQASSPRPPSSCWPRPCGRTARRRSTTSASRASPSR